MDDFQWSPYIEDSSCCNSTISIDVDKYLNSEGSDSNLNIQIARVSGEIPNEEADNEITDDKVADNIVARLKTINPRDIRTPFIRIFIDKCRKNKIIKSDRELAYIFAYLIHAGTCEGEYENLKKASFYDKFIVCAMIINKIFNDIPYNNRSYAFLHNINSALGVRQTVLEYLLKCEMEMLSLVDFKIEISNDVIDEYLTNLQG